MTPLNVILAVGLAATAPLSLAQNYGKYVGTVQTEWLEDGRRMRLLAPFSYFDPNGQKWPAPRGSIVDGASIPQFAWSFIGGPFEGKYRNASVIHDVSCNKQIRQWEAVHETFYWAMRASGVETWRAKVMYAAVYHFGPRWPYMVTVRGLPEKQTSFARYKALKRAAPESKASIWAVRPSGVPLPGTQRKADFDVAIYPPPRILVEEDFSKLEYDIINGKSDPYMDGGGGGGGGSGREKVEFTLEDIRNFRP